MSFNATAHRPFSPGDIAFEFMSTLFLWILIPGCGFFYNGMSRSRSSLTVLMLSFWSIVIVALQWYMVGYSLAFSSTASPFIGDFRHAFFIGVYDGFFAEAVANQVPEMLFCFYQCVTAMLGPALLLGVIAERGRILPAIVFILMWTTLVYDPIACWSLNYRGWSARLGVLDFGGGAPVHVPAAAAALAYTLLLGPRLKVQEEPSYQPHSIPNLVLGTTLLWLGTIGNNCGSAFSGNLTGIMTIFTTNLSASAGAITWSVIDYRLKGCLSAFGFCSGAVSGLITVIPASGFISPSSSILMGILGAAGSNMALNLFSALEKFEDTLDILALHGTSGVLGNVLTGVLAQKAYGGELARNGGWLDGHWVQVPIQILDTVAAFGWSFTVSYIALYCMNRIPCLKLRVSSSVEREGMDESQVGINAYEFIDRDRQQDIPYIFSPLAVIPTKGNAILNNKYRIYPVSFLP